MHTATSKHTRCVMMLTFSSAPTFSKGAVQAQKRNLYSKCTKHFTVLKYKHILGWLQEVWWWILELMVTLKRLFCGPSWYMWRKKKSFDFAFRPTACRPRRHVKSTFVGEVIFYIFFTGFMASCHTGFIIFRVCWCPWLQGSASAQRLC